MPRSVSGFSLLEMLLVLFVVVVLTSLVSLNVGSGADTRLREQAALSIRDGVVFALDEAQFTGRDFGLLLQAGTEFVARAPLAPGKDRNAAISHRGPHGPAPVWQLSQRCRPCAS